MLNSYDGHAFEADVIQALRRGFSCDVFTSKTLDRQLKVDGEIRRIGRDRLKKPVQIQLTRRIDHYGKLDAYLSSRWPHHDIVSLYAEAHPGPSVREVAEHLVWAAKEVQDLPPYGDLPIFGIRIDDDASFFDPHARLRELGEEYQSKERLAALSTGKVHDYDENGFYIMHKTGTSYYAHYIDAFDPEFRRRLRKREIRIPVRFLPVGPTKATDVRFIGAS